MTSNSNIKLIKQASSKKTQPNIYIKATYKPCGKKHTKIKKVLIRNALSVLRPLNNKVHQMYFRLHRIPYTEPADFGSLAQVKG